MYLATQDRAPSQPFKGIREFLEILSITEVICLLTFDHNTQAGNYLGGQGLVLDPGLSGFVSCRLVTPLI